MSLDLRKIIEDIKESATLTCGADAFVDDILKLLDSLDAEYVDLESTIYSFEYECDDDEIGEFSDTDKIIEQVLKGDDEDAKNVVKQMVDIKSYMADIIFGAKLIIDEGIKTCGNFYAEKDDYKQKFVNATEFVNGLEIIVPVKDQILLSLAGRSSIINLFKHNERATNLDVWNNGSATVFDYKLQKLCNDECSPELKQAKEIADEKVFEYYKAKLYENIKNEENIK